MKRIFASLLALLLLCGCTSHRDVVADSIVTGTGIVVDRAMSDGYPYIGIEFADGTELCIWSLAEIEIPDHIDVGDSVEIRYGIQKNTGKYIIVDICEIK